MRNVIRGILMPKSRVLKSLKFASLLAAIGASSQLANAKDDKLFEVIGEIKLNKPAFIFIDQETESSPKNLLITSFSPFFGGHSVTLIPSIENIFEGASSLNLNQITTEVTWPNEASRAPETVFGKDHLIVAGGFLVPGNDKGSIDVVNMETGDIRSLVKKKGGWFYHRALWHDMNQDGRLDILTARAKKSLFGSGGEMVWLEQPENVQDEWKEHFIIKNGPDVHFRIHDFNGDGQVEIISTDFFSKKLSIHWKENNTWITKVIDNTLGSAFELELVDINVDGKLDLLVTNHEGNQSAAVFGYEIPTEFRLKSWKRHTLYSGFVTRQRGFNQASPGEAQAFYPDLNNKKGKPWIMVAGDGSQRAHILTPKTQATSDWEYEEKAYVDLKSTVGKISISDVNGDGMVEAFIPAWDKNLVKVISFK